MDPVADMLVIIKNGYMAHRSHVLIPYSKFKFAIAKVLEKGKFIGKVAKDNSKISAELLYEEQKPRLTEIKRVSKLGLRVYARAKRIHNIKRSRGMVIVSTSKGLMTEKEAKAKNLGGEVICQVW